MEVLSESLSIVSACDAVEFAIASAPAPSADAAPTTAVPTFAAPLAIEAKAEPTFEPDFSAFSVVLSMLSFASALSIKICPKS